MEVLGDLTRRDTTMNANPRFLTDDQLEQFWHEGYLVLKDTLTDEVVETARNAILEMMPRDLSIPEHYIAYCGRIKPMHGDGNHSMYTPELLPLLQNEGLYGAAADILETDYIRVGDGSVGITLRDTGHEGRIQNLHLDARPAGPEDLNQGFLQSGIGIGGCYYLSSVEENGGGIHVVPGAPNRVRDILLNEPDGLARNDTWTHIVDFPPSVEVTGDAGDFVLMHHLMPHGASANRRSVPRVAQFTRLYPVTDEESRQAPGSDRSMSSEALAALTTLGRKMFRITPWVG